MNNGKVVEDAQVDGHKQVADVEPKKGRSGEKRVAKRDPSRRARSAAKNEKAKREVECGDNGVRDDFAERVSQPLAARAGGRRRAGNCKEHLEEDKGRQDDGGFFGEESEKEA